MEWLPRYAIGFMFCAFMGGYLITSASESDLNDPLESTQTIPPTSPSSLDSTPTPNQKSDHTTPKPQTTPNPPNATTTKSYKTIMEVGNMDDFLTIRKNFPWIRSVGLVMVSFDDGSFRSGFGLLLPQNLFLTSAELGHNAGAYPKNILLKMRDESAGNLVCIAELRLKALDKVQGLSLFEVSGYTDDHCNLRSQSYYHSKILADNAYDITTTPAHTNKYYTVTTTFNAPNISSITLNNTNKLPIKNQQKIVFGRPFFSKKGEFLGMTSLPNKAITPVIVSYKDIKNFLCGLDKSGFFVNGYVQDLCHP